MTSVALPLNLPGLSLPSKDASAQPSERKEKENQTAPKETHAAAEPSKGKEEEKQSMFSRKKYSDQPAQALDSKDESETEEGELKESGEITEEFAPESEQQTEGYVQPDLYEGLVASAEQRNNRQPVTRPEKIEKHWKSLYILVKSWWGRHGEDLGSSQQKIINDIQKDIRRECVKIVTRDLAQNPDKYKTVRDGTLETAKEENEKQEEEMQMSVEAMEILVDQRMISHYVQKMYLQKYRFPQQEILGHMKGIAATMEKLKDWNIPLQSILSPYAHQVFNSIVNHSDETREKWRSIVTELNKPTKDQEEIWQLAAPGIRDIVTTVYTQEMLDDASIKKVDNALRNLTEQDHRMQISNAENSISETTNALPLSLLNQIINDWKAENRAEMDADKQALSRLLAMQPLAANLTKSLITVDQSMVEKSLGSRAPQSPISQQKNNVPNLLPSGQASSSKSKTANPVSDMDGIPKYPIQGVPIPKSPMGAHGVLGDSYPC
ncbi:hypothetical protein EJ02DRAFT_494709 [Clathrospora elynae]|uniref:Uncharacterized protein n=1 Tax=Clathrospora elynae TaxID=706981 RepID=A0A6A5SLA8_9PLEO|nr:hypothetical protein EJ02DRAFT_494709 [Clathrospora elynae]